MARGTHPFTNFYFTADSGIAESEFNEVFVVIEQSLNNRFAVRETRLYLSTMSDSEEEKKGESYQEDVGIAGDGHILHSDSEMRQTAERKLVRKLDFRLLPTIVLIFIMNYIDVSEFSCLHIDGQVQVLG